MLLCHSFSTLIAVRNGRIFVLITQQFKDQCHQGNWDLEIDLKYRQIEIGCQCVRQLGLVLFDYFVVTWRPPGLKKFFYTYAGNVGYACKIWEQYILNNVFMVLSDSSIMVTCSASQRVQIDLTFVRWSFLCVWTKSWLCSMQRMLNTITSRTCVSLDQN